MVWFLKAPQPHRLAAPADGDTVDVEHPTGFFTVAMEAEMIGGELKVRRSALLRTARRLMRGEVYVPASVWDGRR